ncbi:MAG: extracellular solute-binding protein [Kofleriaceae bacterium]
MDRRWIARAVVALVAGCGPAPAAPAPPVRFMHTLSPPEAAALDELLAGRAEPVERTLLPFSRAEAVVGATLARADDCPDLIRVDATWLPALAAAARLVPPPPALAARDWTPAARDLATAGGALVAVPMSLDGLVLVRPSAQPAPTPWPPSSLDALEAEAAAATQGARHGLGLRVDGYWLVPFLRARGADVADGGRGTLGIDGPAAEAALAELASLFADGIAAPPAPPGAEAETEAARFHRGELALLVTGPWAYPALATPGPDGLTGLDVAAVPGAPRGAQLLVVPTCARAPERAWALAAELTAPATQVAWSRRLGLVPTTLTALAAAAPLAQATARALADATPLPRHPLSAALFDDLSPAVAAVVAGDATAAEALAGVRRAWTRALEAR